MALTSQERASLLAVIDSLSEVSAPPPAPAPNELHFSQGTGNNANPGTLAAPKQNLTGINHNTLPAGTVLRFRRGDTWTGVFKTLENLNTSASAPLVFDAYGQGPRPRFEQTANNMFHLGGNWNNQSNDGGYVFRNITMDGMGTAEWCFWFVHRVRDVVIEDCEITGFRIGINSNDTPEHTVTDITIRRNHIHHNRAMGMLGHYSNLLFEDNHVQANNFSGSGFDHGTYIGGGNNIILRGNHYDRNSVVNGVCQGGNMTFHGQIDGLLIEDNLIEQDAAAPGGWLMSITQGYTTAEWFRNAVVRRNRLVNGGNTAIAVQSAPGILVEENEIVNDQGTNQTAVFIGSNEYVEGDALDGNAVVRNNRIIQRNGSSGTPVVFLNGPGSVEYGNTVQAG